MKRKFLFGLIILIVVMLSSSFCQAQLLFNKGIKGGLNFASFSSDADLDFSNRTGTVFGGYLKINLPKLALQAEFLYSPKGAKFTIAGNESEIKVTYFEIPLLVKYNGNIAPLVSYNIHGGPSMAFKISEDANSESDGDFFKDRDLGIVVGIGLNISALISEVNIDVRYIHGLNNVSNVEGGSEYKNKVFMILLGIGL